MIDTGLLVTRAVIWTLPFALLLVGYLGKRVLHAMDALTKAVQNLDRTVAVLDVRASHMENKQHEMYEELRAKR